MTATELWLVRHGESTANVQATETQRARLEVIPVEHRDADVPLSDTGVRQAEALGSVALGVSGLERSFLVDERLRDRELGILDTLTSHGVDERYPEEAARRRWLGKFYYRPPGGEAWTDVALRVRSFLRDVDADDASGPVLVAAHDAVVLVFLYLCLGWSEQELLAFAAGNTVLNASVTRLTRQPGERLWTLEVFSDDAHLEAVGAPITEHAGDTDVQPI
jgi:broad specificity phosphatase PhoE